VPGRSAVPASSWKRRRRFHSGLADRFDDIEHRLAFLLPHDIAEQSSEKPNIVEQRAILLRHRHRIDSVFASGNAPLRIVHHQLPAVAVCNDYDGPT